MKTNKELVLELVRNSKGYVSGQEICDRLNVSRTAVWKNINALREDGYEIEAIRNKGYRLVRNTKKLSAGEIRRAVKNDRIGCQLVVLDETDSTNNEAKRQAEQGAPGGLLVVCDAQTQGKGRRGRGWSSPKGSNIYMSLMLRPDFMPDRASMLTLVAAMAAREAILNVTGLDTQIKWPNDLVANGRKLCGILTEMSAETDYIHHVVIGIGINTNIAEFPEEIRNTATSLMLEGQGDVDRNLIIAEFCDCFAKKYALFCQRENMLLLKQEYDANLVNLGREVRILDPAGAYDGVAEGIDEEGRLIVKKADNSREKIMSGEVSVRGVYGYV